MGQGTLLGAEATLFAPVGQRRCCVARLVLEGLREKVRCGAVYLSGGPGRRAGGRGEWRRRVFAGDGTRLHPGKAFRVIHPWRTRRSPPSACGENRPPALPAPATFPQPSRGRLAGSARTRPRDQPLGIPFWGTLHLPRLSVSQNAAGGRPLLVGLLPSILAAALIEPKRSTPAPCSWGGRSSIPSQRRCQPALPAASASSAAWSWASVCASGAW